MIGIILTGHGNFASGLNSALELIAGKQSNFEVVDFKCEDSADDLEAKLGDALGRLKECDEIAFLADLAGGTPFKSSVMLSINEKERKSFVIAGTNLGMLLEVSISRYEHDIESLRRVAAESGVESVKLYETKIRNNEDNEGL